MATRTWKASGTGDWGTAGNWEEGAVPVNGDDVFLLTGSQSVTAGLDQNTVALASLRIGPGYTGTIGTSSADLRIDATTLDFASGGTSAYLAGAYTNVIVKGGSGEDMLHFGKTTAADSDIDNLRIVGGSVTGKVTVNNSTVLDDVYIQSAPAATLVIGTSVTSLDSINMDSGSVTCGSACTTFNVDGGTLTHTTGAVTTINIEGQGVVAYNSSGTITTLNVYGGLISFRDNVSNSVTITAGQVHTDGVIDLRNSLRNVGETNGITVYGGRIIYDHGQVASW